MADSLVSLARWLVDLVGLVDCQQSQQESLVELVDSQQSQQEYLVALVDGQQMPSQPVQRRSNIGL